MKNVLFKAGIMVLLLLFGMMILGCSNDDSDEWEEVTSLYQLHGTWKAEASGHIGIIIIDAYAKKYISYVDDVVQDTMEFINDEITALFLSNLRISKNGQKSRDVNKPTIYYKQ